MCVRAIGFDSRVIFIEEMTATGQSHVLHNRHSRLPAYSTLFHESLNPVSPAIREVEFDVAFPFFDPR